MYLGRLYQRFLLVINQPQKTQPGNEIIINNVNKKRKERIITEGNKALQVSAFSLFLTVPLVDNLTFHQ